MSVLLDHTQNRVLRSRSSNQNWSDQAWGLLNSAAREATGKRHHRDESPGKGGPFFLLLGSTSGDDAGCYRCPQNQTFAHAYTISDFFCNGFKNSLIQIHRDSHHFPSFLPLVPWCRSFPTMYPILNQNLRLQKDLDQPPLQRIRIKVLQYYTIILYDVLFSSIITSLQNDLNLLPSPKNTYKGLLFYLILKYKWCKRAAFC